MAVSCQFPSFVGNAAERKGCVIFGGYPLFVCGFKRKPEGSHNFGCFFATTLLCLVCVCVCPLNKDTAKWHESAMAVPVPQVPTLLGLA